MSYYLINVKLIPDKLLILSTTRPYLGAFARVPKKYDHCVCSSAFALADGLKTDRVIPDYLLLFLKGPAGLRQMERRMTGGLYPAIIQRELEQIIIPIPSKSNQRKIIKAVSMANKKIQAIREDAELRIHRIQQSSNNKLLGEF